MRQNHIFLGIRLKPAGAVFAALGTLGAILSLLLFAKEVSQGLIKGVQICLEVIIPSLFCFIALSGLVMNTRLAGWIFRPVSSFAAALYGVEKQQVPLVFMSLIGGYPVGAKMIAEEVQGGRMTLAQARRLLCFCVNSGPAFLIGSVAVPIFHSPALGGILFLSHFLSSFLIAQLTRSKGRGATETQAVSREYGDFSSALVEAVRSAARSLCLICCFVLLFNAVNTILEQVGVLEWLCKLFSPMIPRELTRAFCFGVLEVTNGCLALPSQGMASVLLASGLTAFGGLCVQMQVKAMISHTGISMGLFYKTRILYTIFSVGITALLMKLFPQTVPTGLVSSAHPVSAGAVSFPASIFTILLVLFLLFQLPISGIIKKSKGNGGSRHGQKKAVWQPH